jgi:hypothetical protein
MDENEIRQWQRLFFEFQGIRSALETIIGLLQARQSQPPLYLPYDNIPSGSPDPGSPNPTITSGTEFLCLSCGRRFTGAHVCGSQVTRT